MTMTADQPQSKAEATRDRRIYTSRSEQMKYYMRRIRGSLLPHYPERETKNGER